MQEGAAVADAICQRMAGILLMNGLNLGGEGWSCERRAGDGVERDIERSRQLLHAAAQSHDIPAMAYLG